MCMAPWLSLRQHFRSYGPVGLCVAKRWYARCAFRRVPVGAGLLAVRRGGAALAFVGKLGLARFAGVDVLVVITLKSAC